MRQSWFKAIFVLCWLAQTVVIGRGVCATDRPAGAELLPKDTLLFASVPNGRRAKEMFEKSAVGQMLNDPELKAIVDAVQTAGGIIPEEARGIVALTLSDLPSLAQGEVTVAIMQRPATRLAFLLMIEYGDNQDSVEKLLTRVYSLLNGNSAKFSNRKSHGVNICIHTWSDGNSDNLFKTIAYCHDGSRLLIATEVTAIEEVLDRQDAKSIQTLANDEVFRRIQEQCREEAAEPIFVWYVNPTRLFRAAFNITMDLDPQAIFQSDLMIRSYSLDKIKGWGGATYVGKGDVGNVTRTFLYAETDHDDLRGLADLFQLPPTELTPPSWIPADVNFYLAGNWNLESAYEPADELWRLIPLSDRTLKKTLNHAANSLFAPGLDPKTDLIDCFRGRFHLFQVEKPGAAPPRQQFAVALELKDAAQVKRTLSAAAGFENSHVTTRELHGETIHERNDAPGQAIAFAVVSDLLIWTNDSSLLERIIAKETPPALAESAAYRKLASRFPTKASIVAFYRYDSLVKAFFEWAVQHSDSEILNGVDVSKLPLFQTVQKYLRPCGFYTIPTEKGVLSVFLQ